MLSRASRQSFLWPPALFPMTRSLAVVEAVDSGVEVSMVAVSMVAGGGPPTSEAVLGDMLTCPGPLHADPQRARRSREGLIAPGRIAA